MACEHEHNSEEPPGSGITDATLITEEVFRSAVEACKGRTFPDDDVLLPSEPVLSACVRHDLLKMCGKLALSGACTDIVSGVAADSYNTVLIAITAMRVGYQRLLNDILPTDFGGTEPSSPSEGEGK